MYYTSRLIKLTARLNSYLELIQDANNRYEDKRTTNVIYVKKGLGPFHFNYSFNERYMERMKELSFWLVSRMQNVLIEINEVNMRQAKKELETISNDEVSTIEL